MTESNDEQGIAWFLPQLIRKILRWPVRIILTGFIIILPFVILGFLFGMALEFVRSLLEPIIAFLSWAGLIRAANFGIVGRTLIELGFYDNVFGFFVEFLAVSVLLSTVIILGIVASFRSGKRILDLIDLGIMTIPVIGPVYKSFRRMGDVVLESGLDKFRSVKLVEFPNSGNYTLAFETNRAPESVRSAANNDDMVTLFVPLAPNPVMGGFLIHVSRDDVFEIDMTVEEAARALITSGIAGGEDELWEPQSITPFQKLKEINNPDMLTDKSSMDFDKEDNNSKLE